jgi:group II intron maturase
MRSGPCGRSVVIRSESILESGSRCPESGLALSNYGQHLFMNKKRTALLVKLKEIFRASRSQPVRGVIEKINPILRGWVKYFAIGHSSRCFSFVQNVG